MAPEDLAALERVAETIAAALPKTRSLHLRRAVFAMSAAVSIVRWRSSALLNPPAVRPPRR